MTTENKVTVSEGGTMFAGPVAVDLYRAMMVKTALRLYVRTKLCMIRGVTGPKMVSIVSEYTGKVYKGKERYAVALADLEAYVETAKATMQKGAV